MTVETSQKPHLVLVDRADNLATGVVLYELHAGPTVLGSLDASIPPDIALAGLEEAHCTITCEGDVIQLLPGRGRTLVDDVAVESQVELHQGQSITLGDLYLFKLIHPSEVCRALVCHSRQVDRMKQRPASDSPSRLSRCGTVSSFLTAGA